MRELVTRPNVPSVSVATVARSVSLFDFFTSMYKLDPAAISVVGLLYGSDMVIEHSRLEPPGTCGGHSNPLLAATANAADTATTGHRDVVAVPACSALMASSSLARSARGLAITRSYAACPAAPPRRTWYASSADLVPEVPSSTSGTPTYAFVTPVSS